MMMNFSLVAVFVVLASSASIQNAEDKLADVSLVQTGNFQLGKSIAQPEDATNIFNAEEHALMQQSMTKLEDAANMLSAEGHGLMQRGSGYIPKHGAGSWGQTIMMLIVAALCLVGARGAHGPFEAVSESEKASWQANSVLGLQRSVHVQRARQKAELREDAEDTHATNVVPTLLQESTRAESEGGAVAASSVLGLQRRVSVRKTSGAALKEGNDDVADASPGPVLLQESAVSDSTSARGPAASLLSLQRSVTVRKMNGATLKEDGDDVATASAGPVLLQESTLSGSASAPVAAASSLGLQRSVSVRKTNGATLEEEGDDVAGASPVLLQESMALDATKAASVLGLQRRTKLRKAVILEDGRHGSQPLPAKGPDDVDPVDGMVVGLQRGIVVDKALVAQEESSDDEANGVWLQRASMVVKPKVSSTKD